MGLHMQVATTVVPIFANKKRMNPMEIAESSYKRLNKCFVAIKSFPKVY